MSVTPKDSYGYPSMLGANRDGKVVPIRVNDVGNIIVEGSLGSTKKLKKVMHFDMATARDKELVDESFLELTVYQVPRNFDLYLDEDIESKKIPISEKLNINANATKFYISNTAGTGELILCLWE